MMHPREVSKYLDEMSTRVSKVEFLDAANIKEDNEFDAILNSLAIVSKSATSLFIRVAALRDRMKNNESE